MKPLVSSSSVLYLVYLCSAAAAPEKCGLYLAPSTLPGAGRGIIAGDSFAENGIVEVTVSLGIPSSISRMCQLHNYVFGYDAEYDEIIFGGGVLYNHMHNKTVQHFWTVDNVEDIVPPSTHYLPYTMMSDVQFLATQPIVPGQEVYTNYGLDWFEKRGMAEQDVNATTDMRPTTQIAAETLVSLEDLEKVGHCLTDVSIRTSTTTFAGRGLFAERDFAPGDVVSIAPVLTLPRSIVDSTLHNSILANYCFTLPNNASEVTLFPVNNAMMINHQPTGTANVMMEWYDWATLPSEGTYFENLQENVVSLEDKLGVLPGELFAAPFAQLDIAFTAISHIAEGEEITLDYGDSWGLAWNLWVEDVKAWEAEQKELVAQGLLVGVDGQVATDIDLTRMPPFRSYMEVPDALFPAHWRR